MAAEPKTAGFKLARDQAQRDGRYRSRAALHQVAREVYNDPDDPVRADPGWLNWSGGVVRGLVEQARAGDLAVLPVLADALEEAGCAEKRLLDHLRRPAQEHCTDCWALALLAG